MLSRKNIYFASDFHLGIPDAKSSLEREKRIVQWLNSIKDDCAELFIVGDVFDFWFEYKTVVPKGFVRLQAKFAEFTDAGIPVHFFHGNHDLWQFGYFEEELGVQVHAKPITRNIHGKTFHIAHGDGLGPNQRWFKFILSIYRNYFFQRVFAFFHPNVGIRIANWFSANSKKHTFTENAVYYGDDKEFLMLYAKQFLSNQHVDFFIFGHRHLPMVKPITNSSTFVNLGDWISYFTYVVFDGETLSLKVFKDHD